MDQNTLPTRVHECALFDCVVMSDMCARLSSRSARQQPQAAKSAHASMPAPCMKRIWMSDRLVVANSAHCACRSAMKCACLALLATLATVHVQPAAADSFVQPPIPDSCEAVFNSLPTSDLQDSVTITSGVCNDPRGECREAGNCGSGNACCVDIRPYLAAAAFSAGSDVATSIATRRLQNADISCFTACAGVLQLAVAGRHA